MRPPMTLRILSLGWGVQSFTLAAMAALGEIEPLDFALHADTGHERLLTYGFAAAWAPWLEDHGVHVVTVHPENDGIWRPEWSSVMIPAFTTEDGKPGQVKRQCTHDWKLVPMRRHIAAQLAARGLKKTAGAVESVQGISYDEWTRMRSSDVAYITNAYPLVDRRISRQGCAEWLEAHNLPQPVKSSCTFCPFHKLGEWREMKRIDGLDWMGAVAADDLLATLPEAKGEFYVHPARLRLAEAVRIPEDVGAAQLGLDGICDGGYCDV